MRARNKKFVSLLEFIQTGRFGLVELGWTKNRILTEFYKPDDKGYMGHGMSIWRYSTFEFHFVDDILTMFWCDGLRWLKNPLKKQFKLDKWILRDTSRLTFSYFCSTLDELNINYTIKGTFYDDTRKLPSNVMLLVEGTNVIVYFEDYENVCQSIEGYCLVGIGASEMHSEYKVREL